MLLGAYLVRRFGLMLVTLFGISIIIFMLLRLTPGNIADILFDAGGFVDPADKARIEADLGLDKPIPVQYAKWIGGLLRGDLGHSYQTEKPAIDEIAPRKQLMVEIYRPSDGKIARFPVRCRIDTPTELEYFRHGGVLNFVLRNLAKAA